MSSSNRSWLADAKPPASIVAYKIDVISSKTPEGKLVKETNIRLQFTQGVGEDICLELLTAITPTLKGFTREVPYQALSCFEPVLVARLIDTEN
jgi:hypothetical protein